MRLGIDIDNVLYDWDGAARNTLLNSGHEPEELSFAVRQQLLNRSTAWDAIEQIVGPKNWDWLWNSADDERMFLQNDFDYDYSASRKAVAELSQHHDVFLITSRPRRYSWQTFQWLGELANPIQARGVIHWNNKVKVARVLNLQVVVDDKAETLQNYLLKARGSVLRGLYIYGVRQPWNQHFSTSYYRFQWIDSLAELLAEQERWVA